MGKANQETCRLIAMKPLISIIVPTYNHASVLEQSLFSASRQTYRPLEVIVVNDGSSDDFSGAIKKIAEQPWIKDLTLQVVSQENKGASAARNVGFGRSKGGYVIFWDADTIAEPEMLQKMWQALEGHSEASYAYSQFRFGWKKIKCRPFDGEALKLINFIDTTSLLRREAAAPFDESLKRFQDWDLWLTLMEKGKTGIFVPEDLYQKKVDRKGYSDWLPQFVYRLPWKSASVRRYEAAREVILSKHHLAKPEEAPAK